MNPLLEWDTIHASSSIGERAIGSGISNSSDTGRRQGQVSPAADRTRPTVFRPVRSLVRKASVGSDLWRIHGGSKFLRQILPWMAHRRYILYEGSLASVLPEFKAQVPEVRISLTAPSDLPLLLKTRPGYYFLGELQGRLKQGHVCFLSRVGSEPVNLRWAFVGSVHLPYLSRTLILAADEFYFDEVFTVPRWRHRGIDEQTFRFMRTWFGDRGFKKQCCLLTSWDTHLHKRYESLGMAKIGELRSRLFGVSKRLVLEGRIQDLGHETIAVAPRKVET